MAAPVASAARYADAPVAPAARYAAAPVAPAARYAAAPVAPAARYADAPSASAARYVAAPSGSAARSADAAALWERRYLEEAAAEEQRFQEEAAAEEQRFQDWSQRRRIVENRSQGSYATVPRSQVVPGPSMATTSVTTTTSTKVACTGFSKKDLAPCEAFVMKNGKDSFCTRCRSHLYQTDEEILNLKRKALNREALFAGFAQDFSQIQLGDSAASRRI